MNARKASTNMNIDVPPVTIWERPSSPKNSAFSLSVINTNEWRASWSELRILGLDYESMVGGLIGVHFHGKTVLVTMSNVSIEPRMADGKYSCI